MSKTIIDVCTSIKKQIKEELIKECNIMSRIDPPL